ncbi:MAG: DUF4397 domain-containing protein [Gemmatimonadetes bacterium]|nr:DUF4397 domain-containing protein [Gemmatimonadota bacterium]
MLRKLRFPMMIVIAAAFAVGCGDDDDGNPTGVNNTGDEATMRVVHASPDAPPVDVYAEGVSTPLVTNLAYGETSAYLGLDAGTYNIEVRAAGAAPESTPVLETGDLVVPAGARITAVAAGLLSGLDKNAEDALRVLVYAEDFTDPGVGNSAVRIVHAGSDAPSVAIDVGNDGAPELTDVARFAESGAAGVALPSDQALQVAIWAGSPLERVTVFTTPSAIPGELFLIATGLLSEYPREEDGFSLLAVGPNGTIGFVKQNPVVFALHASPDVPPVDIYAGDAELYDNLAFGELTSPIQVPPASYTLSFRPNDDGPVAASATTPTLAAGERYLAVAGGFLTAEAGQADFTLLPFGDGFDLDTDDPLVRVVHASGDAPPVDVGTFDGSKVTALNDFSNLAFTEASSSAGTAVPAATLTLGVAAAGSDAAVATFDVTTVSGLRAYAVAAGALAPGAMDEAFRLLIVQTEVFPWTVAEVSPN